MHTGCINVRVTLLLRTRSMCGLHVAQVKAPTVLSDALADALSGMCCHLDPLIHLIAISFRMMPAQKG
eukprot:5045263-Amphidinium_carterae.1